MIHLSLHLPELDQLFQLANRYPEIVAEELLDGMEAAVSQVVREVKHRTPVDQGHLLGQIQGHVEVIDEGVRGIVHPGTAAHAPYVEYGTRPHWPPLKPIQEWVHRKGLGGTVVDGQLTARAPEAEERRIAYLIARKIAREGTKGHEMFQEGFRAAQPDIRRIFQQRFRRAVRRAVRETR